MKEDESRDSRLRVPLTVLMPIVASEHFEKLINSTAVYPYVGNNFFHDTSIILYSKTSLFVTLIEIAGVT